MKKLFRKKIILVVLAVLLIGGGAGYFFLFRNSGGTGSVVEPTEIKVDTVFGYIGSESTYSRFNTLVGMFETEKYLTKNDDGLSPSLIVFAPTNEAFEKDDVKPLETLNSVGKDQIKLYHMAKIYPASTTESAKVELSDGQKITTLSGREIFISKKADSFIVTDAKGREAKVSKKYAVSPKGDRIYFIDQVLLFQ